MNLSVEHVLMFVLVFCAFYYLKNGCGCKEGVSPSPASPAECAESWKEVGMMANQNRTFSNQYYKMLSEAVEKKNALLAQQAMQSYDQNVILDREDQIHRIVKGDIIPGGC
jgi:hypothetical protein